MDRRPIDLLEPETTGELWRIARQRGYQMLVRLWELTERFWLGRGYFPALLGVLALTLATGWHVSGAAILVGIAIWFMAMCPDLLAAVCPMILAIFPTAPEYENLSVFLPCLPLLFLFVAATILHFFIWPVQIRLGSSRYGLAMVSVAAILSGCDNLPLGQRTTPLMLYYTLGLGAGMLAVYAAVRSALAEKRRYDVKHRFALIWLTAGLGMALVVVSLCWRHLDGFAALDGAIPEFKCRNFCAAMLLTAFPAAFYLAARRRLYLIAAGVMGVAMVFTGSRSALLFGAVLAVLGCIYLVRFGVFSRRTMALLLLAAAVFMALFGVQALKTLYDSRIIQGHLVGRSEMRWQLLAHSVKDFLAHPVFGAGLGNTAHSSLTSGVPGSMFFYHNLAAQAAGSMGLLGLAAYGILIGDRARLLFKGRRDPFMMMLAMSYLGMLLLSMTNPGECCPFPNEAMVVTLFAVAEHTVGDAAYPLEQLLPLPAFARGTRVIRSK